MSTFASWDEAEHVLDQMQLAGVLPQHLDPSGAELRIVVIDERRSPSRLESLDVFAHQRLALQRASQRQAERDGIQSARRSTV